MVRVSDERRQCDGGKIADRSLSSGAEYSLNSVRRLDDVIGAPILFVQIFSENSNYCRLSST